MASTKSIHQIGLQLVTIGPISTSNSQIHNCVSATKDGLLLEDSKIDGSYVISLLKWIVEKLEYLV